MDPRQRLIRKYKSQMDKYRTADQMLDEFKRAKTPMKHARVGLEDKSSQYLNTSQGDVPSSKSKANEGAYVQYPHYYQNELHILDQIKGTQETARDDDKYNYNNNQYKF
jgi:flagellar capping protein FliD